MNRKPTQEQAEIIASAGAQENLMINAYAGTGKSTTLEMLAPRVPEKRCAAFAFNREIAQELKPRFPAHFKVQTLNALGYGALIRMLPSHKLDGRKLTILAREQGLVGDDADDVKELTSLAMMAGIVPWEFGIEGLAEDSIDNWMMLGDTEPTEQGIEQAQQLLRESIRVGMRDGLISFDDQIYLSVFFGARYPLYDLVLIDEAQDLSPINHLQLQRTARGRIIAVGDRKQAIYGWRGADHRSMDNLRKLRPEWIERPLTTTFRCPQIIVERCQRHAPGFNARSGAPKGAVYKMTGAGVQGYGWKWRDIEELAVEIGPAASRVVLCRNNAPLVTLALRLLGQHIPARVLGRDIGKKLIKLSRRLAKSDAMPAKALIEAILEWRTTEVSKSEANRDGRAPGIRDSADALIAVAQSVRNAGELRATIDKLFADDAGWNSVTLSTVHKAKGREWDLVVHLDPHLCPSKWAKSAAAQEQERNLRYVLETRTKHTLVEANLEDFS